MNKEARKKMNVPANSACRFPRLAGVVACAALLAGVVGGAGTAQAASFFDDYDFAATDASVSVNEAGGHPDVDTDFEITQDSTRTQDGFGQYPPTARLRNVGFESPPGMTGNPDGFPQCEASTFIGATNSPLAPQCPVDSQVGTVQPGMWNFFPAGILTEPLVVLQPPASDVVARLGFFAAFYPVYVDFTVDPARDYALTTTIVNIPQAYLVAANNRIWGVPTDPSHDAQRMDSAWEPIICGGACAPKPSSLPPTAMASNPTSCGPASIGFTSRSYAETFATPISDSIGDIVDCGPVPFAPAVSLAPTTTSAATAAGIDFEMTIPQNGFSDPTGRASAHLKKAVITMPEGVSLNPSAADGLDSCSQAEIGVTSLSPLRFDGEDPDCPDSSKVGEGTIVTPALADPLDVSLYLADPDDNPFDSLLSGYLVGKGTGIVLKIAGKFDLDPDTGQVVATFDNNPQQPFSSLELNFKGGNRGVITTPSECGTYDVGYELTPWSGNPPEVGTTQFTIDQNCGTGSFSPGFSAGSANALAGSYSPFMLRVTRDAGTQRLTGIDVTPPPGLTGKLAGVPYCPESALNGVQTGIGTGQGEIDSPSCPEASRVGTVIAGAGSGSPFYVETGKAYLAGPYKGAPISLAIVTPAVAGPFDLGNVVVRTAIHVDPETAQLSAVSDPLPTILHGVPLELRDVRVSLDRDEFAKNPTSCEEMSVGGEISGTGGAGADVSERFQVGECRRLGFQPKTFLRLYGKRFGRSSNPRLRAVVVARKGDANIARAAVKMPGSIFLDQDHIRTVCTRAQFATDTCPQASVYGHAAASTPLLDDALSGPVYLRSSDNPLPDLVADLRGQVRVELAGRTDSVRGALRNTFDVVPDAPVSKFVLLMQGGRKSLLVASKNLCASVQRARVNMTAQNGRQLLAFQPINIPRCQRQRRAAKRRAAAKRGARRASLSAARRTG